MAEELGHVPLAEAAEAAAQELARAELAPSAIKKEKDIKTRIRIWIAFGIGIRDRMSATADRRFRWRLARGVGGETSKPGRSSQGMPPTSKLAPTRTHPSTSKAPSPRGFELGCP